MIIVTRPKSGYKPIENFPGTDDVFIVRWDYNEVPAVEGEESTLATWAEEVVYGRPTKDKLFSMVDGYFSEKMKQKIVSGYEVDGDKVWLSNENQMNYKSAYDMAVQTDGQNLPVTFKLGDDKNPVYRSFHSLEELKEFYSGIQSYIQKTLEDGWKARDAIDYSIYLQNNI